MVERPNRGKASSKTAKWIVVLLFLVSVVLLAIVAVGGWDFLQGAKAMLIAYMLLYVVLAIFCARWSRGTLPLGAALAIILAIFAAVAGPEWFTRDKAGFDSPDMDEGLLGTFTLLIIPVQVLLIVVAMVAFRQAWNVEEERVINDGRTSGEPAPAAA